MTETVKRENRLALVLTLLSFLAAAVTFLGSAVWPYRAVWQLIAIATVTLGIQLTQKYLLPTYEYRLEEGDDPHESSPHVTVIQHQGQRNKTLCHLALTACQVLPYCPRKELTARYGEIAYRYSFCVDLRPKQSFYVLLGFREEKAALRLQCSQAFADALTEAAKRAGNDF